MRWGINSAETLDECEEYSRVDGPLSRGSGVQLNGGLSSNATVYGQGGSTEQGHGSDGRQHSLKRLSQS
jgi:hypothetical protein